MAETISTITLKSPSTVTLTTPGSQGTILNFGLLSSTASGLVNLSTFPHLLVRGENLGGGPTGGFTRFRFLSTSDTPGPVVLLSRVFVASTATGRATSFAVSDNGVDAAGKIGIRALHEDEYATGSVIQNPADGGSTANDAYFLAGAATAVSGAPTVKTLTIEDGGSLALVGSQTLEIAGGGVLARGVGTLAGGSLVVSAAVPEFYTSGELTLASSIVTPSTRLVKRGPGALTISSGLTIPTTIVVTEGSLRAGSSGALANETVSLEATGILDLQNGPATVGNLLGVGRVTLGPNSLTLGASGVNVTFAGSIEGSGGVTIVDGGNGGAQRTLSGVSTFTGGVTLQSGTLVVGAQQALGSGPLTINGGSVSASTTVTIGNALVLNQEVVVTGGTLTLGGGVSGPGVLRSSGTLGIQGSANPGGGARVEGSFPGSFGTLIVSGAAGALNSPAGVAVGLASVFKLDDTVAFIGGVGGRMADGAPVHLGSGTLQLLGNAATPTMETMGAVDGAGFSTVLVTPTATAGAQLTAASLSRTERGTFFIRSQNLLGGALAGNVGQIKLATPPAGMIGGIVPYAVGQSGTSSPGLVTFDASNGFRLLTAGEYTTSVANVTASSNVRITFGFANESVLAINSLSLGTFDVVQGSGVLRAASGVVHFTATDNSSGIANSIDFGTVEGNVFVSGGTSADVLLAGLSGSGGLTISGGGIVRMVGANTVSGPLTLNGNVRLAPSHPDALGPGPAPIVINGGSTGAGVQFEKHGTFTVTRDVQVNSGFAYFAGRGTPVDRLVLSGTISGTGGVHIGSVIGLRAEDTATTVFEGTNSYSGPTWIEGRLAITSDAALGNSSSVIFGGLAPVLRLEGPWITSREISGSGKVDTNGFDATLSGRIVGNATLSKSGDGVLILDCPAGTGGIGVSGGVVRLAANGSIPSGVGVGGGGTFQIDNRSTVVARWRSQNLELNDGRYLVSGNATQPTQIAAGALTVSATPTSTTPNASNIITLTAPGSASTTQSFTTYTSTAGGNSFTLFRGDNLGAAPVGAYSRVTFGTAPTLANGLLPGAIADMSSTGGGMSFATYDNAGDSAGPTGVRPLRADEHVVSSSIQNPANGGATPVTANFLATGPVAAVGAGNTLSTLTLDPGSSVSLAKNQTLKLTTNSLLVREGGAGATIAGGTLDVGNLTFKILGGGDLTLASALSTNASVIKYGGGVLTVAGTPANTAITLTLLAGDLRAGPDNPLNNANISMARGTVFDLQGRSTRVASLSGAGSVRLGSETLSLGSTIASISAYGGFSGDISGTGNLSALRDTWLGGANTYTGQTNVAGRATLILGSAGSVLASNRIVATGGSKLVLDESGTAISRIGSAPVTLNGSTIEMDGNIYASITQNAGPLTVIGAAHVVVKPYDNSLGNRVDARLSFADLARGDRGIAVFDLLGGNGPSTVGADLPASFSSALVGDGATPTRRGILPFAVATEAYSSGGQLATFDPVGGIRLLTVAERSSTLTAGDNVRLATNATLASDITLNALELFGLTLTGGGTLRLVSGVLITNGTIGVPIDLGSTEGVFYNAGPATLAGPLSGSNGLTLSTVANNGGFTISGANSFSGPLTLNGGVTTFASQANLGAGSSPIVMNDATLRQLATTGIVLTRDIRTDGTSASFQSTNGRFTLAGAISGPAALNFSGDFELTGINTYQGDTSIAGKLTFGSDSVFGSSTKITLNTASLALTRSWTTSREVRVISAGADTIIDMAGFDATLNGPLRNDQPAFRTVYNTGGGTLTLRDAASYFGGLAVNGGTLAIDGTLGSGSTLAISIGTTLAGNGNILRGVDVAGILSPGHSAGTIHTQSLIMESGSTLAIELASATDYDRIDVTGSVILTRNVNLDLSLLAGFDPADFLDVFTILQNDAADSIGGNGRFSYRSDPLDQDERFRVGAQEFQISYTGGDGNDVTLVPTPEPSSTLLILGATVARAARRRRCSLGPVSCCIGASRDAGVRAC